MKPESLQKTEQALNKIASAQLLLEMVDDADLSEAIACLCRAYDLISELTDPAPQEDPLLEGLGPDLLKAFMQSMIDKSKNE